MNTTLRLIAAAALMIIPSVAFAQADPHHPDAGAGAAAPAAAAAMPAPASPAPAMGDQPANMMQMMQMQMQMMQIMQMMQQMMPMMQQMMGMMQGGMPQGGMAPGMAMPNMPMPGMSDASKAYMGAMSMMNAPMMQALQSRDPDAAFVKAMIPHHQGAIAMAKAVLQYGKDDKVKAWANQIIKAQEAEIAEMQAWLKGQLSSGKEKSSRRGSALGHRRRWRVPGRGRLSGGSRSRPVGLLRSAPAARHRDIRPIVSTSSSSLSRCRPRSPEANASATQCET